MDEDRLSDENVLRKLRGLLALANSPNQHEAELAASRAQDLMLKYNVSIGAVQDSENKGPKLKEKFAYSTKKRVLWRRELLNYIARSNACQVLSSTDLRQFWVVGRPVNVAACLAMNEYLAEAIFKLSWRWLDDLKARSGKTSVPNSRALAESFRRGASMKISERLEERRKKAFKQGVEGCTGLAVQDAYMKAMNEIAEHCKQFGAVKQETHDIKDRNAFLTGVIMSDAISLDAQIEEVQTEKRLIIEKMSIISSKPIPKSKNLEIIATLAALQWPLMMTKFDAECCMACARVGIDVLSSFGIKARPIFVKAMLFNDVFVKRVMKEGHAPTTKHESDNWEKSGAFQMALGYYPKGHVVPDDKIGGHVALIVNEDTLLDVSIVQFRRPVFNIKPEPLVANLDTYDEFIHGLGSATFSSKCGNTLVAYERITEENKPAEGRTITPWDECLDFTDRTLTMDITQQLRYQIDRTVRAGV